MEIKMAAEALAEAYQELRVRELSKYAEAMGRQLARMEKQAGKFGNLFKSVADAWEHGRGNGLLEHAIKPKVVDGVQHAIKPGVGAALRNVGGELLKFTRDNPAHALGATAALTAGGAYLGNRLLNRQQYPQY